MLRASLSVIGMFLALIISAIKVQAEAWRGIVPLRSTQADVERLLGKPGEHGRYQFDKERAFIHYAGTGPCAKANRCLCEVSEDTVISIYVELEVEMSFSGLKLDKKHYTKLISRKNPTIATYLNEEIGIIYTVDEKADDVTAIEYLPAAKDCQDVMRRAKRPGVKKLALAKHVAVRTTLHRLSSNGFSEKTVTRRSPRSIGRNVGIHCPRCSYYRTVAMTNSTIFPF